MMQPMDNESITKYPRPRCAACGLTAREDASVRGASECPRCGEPAIVYTQAMSYAYNAHMMRESRSI